MIYGLIFSVASHEDAAILLEELAAEFRRYPRDLDTGIICSGERSYDIEKLSDKTTDITSLCDLTALLAYDAT